MRVNFILPPPTLSGGFRSNRMIAEALARRGHDVTIAYPMAPRWPRITQPRVFVRHALKRIHSRFKPAHHMLDCQLPIIAVRQPEVEAQHVPDADATIATFWKTREWIENWPRSKGIKCYFVRHHEAEIWDPHRVRATYRHDDVKFVISRWLAEVMEKEYEATRVYHIPNAVDKAIFNSPNRSKSVTPTIGLMLSNVWWKGTNIGLQAASNVYKRHPNLRVVCFGSQRPNLRLPQYAEFHLRPSRSAIAAICRRSDCWLVSSTSEGFGMPGIEAAACGCPIVSTRCGGPEDYVCDGHTGYLVPVNDSDAMADAVTTILEKSSEAWNEMSNASAKLANTFDWDESAVKLEAALFLETAQSKPIHTH